MTIDSEKQIVFPWRELEIDEHYYYRFAPGLDPMHVTVGLDGSERVIYYQGETFPRKISLLPPEGLFEKVEGAYS